MRIIRTFKLVTVYGFTSKVKGDIWILGSHIGDRWQGDETKLKRTPFPAHPSSSHILTWHRITASALEDIAAHCKHVTGGNTIASSKAWTPSTYTRHVSNNPTLWGNAKHQQREQEACLTSNNTRVLSDNCKKPGEYSEGPVWHLGERIEKQKMFAGIPHDLLFLPYMAQSLYYLVFWGHNKVH